jgi:thiol-disulfide isomerase/thioredoxin
MQKRVIAAVIILLAVSFLSCQRASYQDLSKKAAEVDSLIIKARAAGVTNMDSLRTARKDKALTYIMGVDPRKIGVDNYHAAARLFFAAGKKDSALQVLEKFAPAQKEREALTLLFNLYIEKGQVSRAEELFTNAIKELPGGRSAGFYMDLIYSYEEKDELAKAIAIADDAIASLPKEDATFVILEKAELLNLSGDKKGALSLLQQLKEDNPNDPRMMRAINAKANLYNLIGSPAAEWKAAEWIDSKPLALKELRGKVVFLDFWAPWCGPCRAMFPHIKKLYVDYADKGLVILGITRYYGRFNQLGQNLQNLTPAEELEWIKKFKLHHEIPYPYAVAEGDAAAANELAYGVYGIPHMVLIDKKGVVREYAIGSGPASEEKLSKAVALLIAE